MEKPRLDIIGFVYPKDPWRFTSWYRDEKQSIHTTVKGKGKVAKLRKIKCK